MPHTQSGSHLLDIEFPRQNLLIKRLRYISFFINDIVLISAVIALIGYFTSFFGIGIPIVLDLNIQPATTVLFVLCGIVLLFGAKRHQLNSHKDDEMKKGAWWRTSLPITFAGVTALIALLNLSSIVNAGLFAFLYISPFASFCFLLIGLALIPPFTKIPHRFHITQFLIFIVGGVGVYIVLESILHQVTGLSMQHIIQVPLPTASFFTLFCIGVLLRWTNRGFFGNFTLESTVSKLAFRLLVSNLILGPLIAFIVISNSSYFALNMLQVIAIVVTLFAFVTSTLIWMNIRYLYRYELENLLMRESLRLHNIDLREETKTLASKMTQLEDDKQKYAEKLESKIGWQNAIDRFGG